MKKQNDLIEPSQIKAKGKYHDFDGHWKEMIQEFIQEFIEYFLPEFIQIKKYLSSLIDMKIGGLVQKPIISS